MATTEEKPAEVELAEPAEEVTRKRQDGPEPLIEVSAFLPDRPTVTIKMSATDPGTTYELHLMREFGIADQQRLTQDGKEFEKLWNQPSLTKKEGERLKIVLDRMFEKVLIAPQGVKDKLDDQTRSNVVTAFTFAPFAIAAAQESEMEDEDENPTTGT